MTRKWLRGEGIGRAVVVIVVVVVVVVVVVIPLVVVGGGEGLFVNLIHGGFCLPREQKQFIGGGDVGMAVVVSLRSFGQGQSINER